VEHSFGKSTLQDASNLVETEAIRLAQQGDDRAFERIYELHSRRIHAVCLRMTGSRVEAEDLTQEAFLQLFLKIRTFRGESSFYTWLHRLTVNIVLMRFRKKSLVDTSLEEMSERDEQIGRPRREAGGPDPRLRGLLDRLSLRRAVDQLPRRYKAMFILHDVEGYEHNEIAQALGCSISNSKSQLQKARIRLRKLLDEALGKTTNANNSSTSCSLFIKQITPGKSTA
jgi:RNA polymerase sigma-70 factor (ECF subfamily)